MISAKLVKELRDRTGAGMMECKKALTETNGDIDAAADWLRENSDIKAEKKSGRTAAEGAVAAEVSEDRQAGAMIEVNIETDFAARNEKFRLYVDGLAKQALHSEAEKIEEFLDEPYSEDESITVAESCREMIANIGENMLVRRFEGYRVPENETGLIHSYIHGMGSVGVLVQFKLGNEANIKNDAVIEAANNVAMQIAAMNPRWLKREDAPEDVVNEERSVLRTLTLNEGKPEKIVDKIVEGRLGKFFSDNCLLEQEYVRDDKMKVQDYLKQVGKEVGDTIEIVRFTRFELGEGIEKKEEDFAAEVMSQIK